MSSPIAQPSPQTAPRDQASLVRAGRFTLRKLAEQLGIIPTEEQAMAFMGQPTDKQAEAVLTALKSLDAANGGPPPQIMQQTQQPPPANGGFTGFQPPPQQQGFQPPKGFTPPQQPQAPVTNSAPALGSGLGGGLRRAPVNNGVPTNGATTHGPTVAQPPPSNTAGADASPPQQAMSGGPMGQPVPPAGVDITPIMQALANIDAKVTVKEKKGEGVKEVLEEIEFLRKLLAFNFTASILVIESLNQGIDRSEIFETILRDTPLLQDALTPHLTAGKGKKGK